MVVAMTTWFWGMVGGAVCFVVGFLAHHVLALRQRFGGGRPLPAWLVTAERASPALRELVARMARSEAKSVMAEWATLTPGLQKAIRMEIAKMVAEAFAVQDGRRK